MSEEWRTVPGYGNRYMVSSKGRVLSYARSMDGHILMPQPNDRGYLHVTLCGDKEGKVRHSVHRLVLTVFKCPPDGDRHHCAHFNGDPADNRIENLRWATVSENLADRERHGTVNNGARNGRSKLDAADVLAIRSSAVSPRHLAVRFGVTPPHVVRIQRGQTWRHLIPTVKRAAQ